MPTIPINDTREEGYYPSVAPQKVPQGRANQNLHVARHFSEPEKICLVKNGLPAARPTTVGRCAQWG